MAAESKTNSPENFKYFKSGTWNITNNVAQSANSSHGCAIGTKEISSGSYQWLIYTKQHLDVVVLLGFVQPQKDLY